MTTDPDLLVSTGELGPDPLGKNDPAMWVRRLRRCRNEIDRIRELFDEEVNRLTLERDLHLQPLEDAAQALAVAIEQHHRQLHGRGEATLKLVFPHGVSVLGPPAQPRVDIRDLPTFREWARAEGLWVELHNATPEPTPSLTKIAAKFKPAFPLEPNTAAPLVDEDGQEVPGVKLTMGERSHRVGTS
jgi:hypothetical protein